MNGNNFLHNIIDKWGEPNYVNIIQLLINILIKFNALEDCFYS